MSGQSRAKAAAQASVDWYECCGGVCLEPHKRLCLRSALSAEKRCYMIHGRSEHQRIGWRAILEEGAG